MPFESIRNIEKREDREPWLVLCCDWKSRVVKGDLSDGSIRSVQMSFLSISIHHSGHLVLATSSLIHESVAPLKVKCVIWLVENIGSRDFPMFVFGSFLIMYLAFNSVQNNFCFERIDFPVRISDAKIAVMWTSKRAGNNGCDGSAPLFNATTCHIFPIRSTYDVDGFTKR